MATTITWDLSRAALEQLELPESATITDVKHLSSYNWIEAPEATPTIAIPGIPALWSGPRAPLKVKKDSGLIYIAQNAARYPESPLEPLFRALYSTLPSFDVRSIDIITDRNNMRKLLSFVNPSSAKFACEEFTINIEVVQNTAIFCREECKTTEYIGPKEFKGYGHEFEKACTKQQIPGSTGHHRIISYRFGDLNFIVRHETDGYVDNNTRDSSSKAQGYVQDDISRILERLSLTSAENDSGRIPATGTNLIIKEQGQVIPLESTLEIKTRVAHKRLDIQDIAPQLWLSQTPKLVRAYHHNGTFQKPVVEGVATAVKDWEKRNQDDLRKLAALSRLIVKRVQALGGKAVIKYDVQADKLLISRVEAKDMLPKDLYSKWDDDVEEVVEEVVTQVEDTQETTSSTPPPPDEVEVTFRIGNEEYQVFFSEMPYLRAVCESQKLLNPNATTFFHEPIKHFDIALKGLESGLRQCFRLLPPRLSEYRALLQTYIFLGVPLLGSPPISLRHVLYNLSVCSEDEIFGPQARGRSRKALARDSAFHLLHILLLPREKPDNYHEMEEYLSWGVCYVLSNPDIFRSRMRRVILLAFTLEWDLDGEQKGRVTRLVEEGGEDEGPTDGTTASEDEPVHQPTTYYELDQVSCRWTSDEDEDEDDDEDLL